MWTVMILFLLQHITKISTSKCPFFQPKPTLYSHGSLWTWTMDGINYNTQPTNTVLRFMRTKVPTWQQMGTKIYNEHIRHYHVFLGVCTFMWWVPVMPRLTVMISTNYAMPNLETDALLTLTQTLPAEKICIAIKQT